jgi:hypothetical protein
MGSFNKKNLNVLAPKNKGRFDDTNLNVSSSNKWGV